MLLSWNVQYHVYQDKQSQIDTLQSYQSELDSELKLLKEEHRPRLVVNASIVPDTTILYTQNDLVEFDVLFAIKNIDDRPAYQYTLRGFSAPLADPSKIRRMNDITQLNPTYSGLDEKVRYHYFGYYTNVDDELIVLIYTDIKYCDSPNNGNWYGDPYWFSVRLDISSNESWIGLVEREWRDFYSPYLSTIFPEDNRE